MAQNSQTKNSVAFTKIMTEFNDWRMTKKTRTEKIPKNIWDQILDFLETEPSSHILYYLQIKKNQVEKERQLRQAKSILHENSVIINEDTEAMEFCEAQSKTNIPLAYKPAKAFTTTTSVVELYRPDGMLMKIHLCTDRFEELLSAFFKG
jgi:arylamine N-acetyltransferase